MGFIEAVKYNFQHYADFKGRAQRSQYWWWALFVLITTAILNTWGTEGWELVQIVTGPEGGLVAYLKRPLAE